MSGNKLDVSFEDEKRKYLSQTREERRRGYKAKVVYLDSLTTWAELSKDEWETPEGDKPKATDSVEKVSEDLAKKIVLWIGDITLLEIDAIVNAANRALHGGGGVDGAIHRVAGPSLKKESMSLAPCPVGEAKITGGYGLPAKYVIHTVGPQGEKPDKLRACYRNCLSVAKENNLRTIAFPCISTGVYGYPQEPAANVAITTVKQFLIENPNDIDRVVFCVFLKADEVIYKNLLAKYFALD